MNNLNTTIKRDEVIKLNSYLKFYCVTIREPLLLNFVAIVVTVLKLLYSCSLVLHIAVLEGYISPIVVRRIDRLKLGGKGMKKG